MSWSLVRNTSHNPTIRPTPFHYVHNNIVAARTALIASCIVVRSTIVRTIKADTIPRHHDQSATCRLQPVRRTTGCVTSIIKTVILIYLASLPTSLLWNNIFVKQRYTTWKLAKLLLLRCVDTEIQRTRTNTHTATRFTFPGR